MSNRKETKPSNRKARVEFRKALETALESTRTVAEGIRVGRSTIYLYLDGSYPVPPEVAKRFSKYLRKRARAFTEAADRLEAAARREREQ